MTQNIVSKAEDRFVDLAGVRPGAAALRLAEITRKVTLADRVRVAHAALALADRLEE